MKFELLLSNGHHVEWEYEPYSNSSASVYSAMKALYESPFILCRHLGSGRDVVWVNPTHVVFAELAK